MKKKIEILLPALCLCMLAFNCFAQFAPLAEKKYVDSVEALIQSHTVSDSIKARECFNLSLYWDGRNPDNAYRYIEKGRAFAKGNPFLQAFYHYALGRWYEVRNAGSKENEAFKKADSILANLSTTSAYGLRASIWHGYAREAQMNNDPVKAQDILIGKVLPFARRTNSNHLTGTTLIEIGIGLENLHEYNKAVPYFNEAIEILKRPPVSTPELVNAYFVAIDMYLDMGKPVTAKAFLDSSKILLQPAPDSKFNIEYNLLEGQYYNLTEQYNKALKSFDKGLALVDKLNIKDYDITDFRLQKYNVYTSIHNYEKAKDFLLEILNDKYPVPDEDRATYYSELADSYYRMGRMADAFKWEKKYSMLKDSLQKKNVLEKINALEAKFQSSEKEKKILALQSEKDKAALQSQKQKAANRLLMIACIFLAVTIFLAIIYYKKITAQKEINHWQQLKDIEQQHQLKVAQAMLEGEERERARVAQDLHDGLGGMLAGVKINLSGWADNHSGTGEDNELHKVIDQLDNSVGELRRIARNMMPVTLLRFGLLPALEELCDFYKSPRLEIAFQYFNIDGKNISLPLQLNIYRIVQELLSNAVKHSGADNIMLQCSYNEEVFFITVEDNGQGFDTGKISMKKGMGLSNIKNRIDYLRGKMEINSSGEGTVINIEFPTDEQ